MCENKIISIFNIIVNYDNSCVSLHSTRTRKRAKYTQKRMSLAYTYVHLWRSIDSNHDRRPGKFIGGEREDYENDLNDKYKKTPLLY